MSEHVFPLILHETLDDGANNLMIL